MSRRADKGEKKRADIETKVQSVCRACIRNEQHSYYDGCNPNASIPQDQLSVRLRRSADGVSTAAARARVEDYRPKPMKFTDRKEKGKEPAMLTTLIVFPAILMIMGFETFRTIGR
jgi:hypothetical protein